MKKSVGIGIAAAALGFGGLLFWLAPEDPQAGVAEPIVTSGSFDGGSGGAAPPESFTTGLEALPASLAGTDVDGELEVDAAGHLKITGAVRRVFDYFLSTLGEEKLETIQARVRAYLRHKLKDPAATEAEQLFDSYLAYKRALQDVQQAGGQAQASYDTQALRRQLDQVQGLRRQFFSPEVITAFFGAEDLYDRYTLSRQDVLQDKRLSAVQRAQQLAALEQQLPPQLREAIGTITKAQSLETLTADWKARGGSAAELRQIREKLVGPEAADRLESLDSENAAWKSRMDAWYGERAAILGNRNLSEQDRARQLEQARNARFDADERARVESLERMKDRGETIPD